MMMAHQARTAPYQTLSGKPTEPMSMKGEEGMYVFHTVPMKTPGSNAGMQSIMTQVSRQKLWERVSMYFVFLENRPGLSEREVGIMQTWPVNADLIWGLSKEEINEELQKVRELS